jgi:hypothetical protein
MASMMHKPSSRYAMTSGHQGVTLHVDVDETAAD